MKVYVGVINWFKGDGGLWMFTDLTKRGLLKQMVKNIIEEGSVDDEWINVDRHKCLDFADYLGTLINTYWNANDTMMTYDWDEHKHGRKVTAEGLLEQAVSDEMDEYSDVCVLSEWMSDMYHDLTNGRDLDKDKHKIWSPFADDDIGDEFDEFEPYQQEYKDLMARRINEVISGRT